MQLKSPFLLFFLTASFARLAPATATTEAVTTAAPPADFFTSLPGDTSSQDLSSQDIPAEDPPSETPFSGTDSSAPETAASTSSRVLPSGNATIPSSLLASSSSSHYPSSFIVPSSPAQETSSSTAPARPSSSGGAEDEEGGPSTETSTPTSINGAVPAVGAAQSRFGLAAFGAAVFVVAGRWP
ncbi:hypothetical protein VTH06DRAFT_1009 [Thermothelomyces fergusii]